MDKTQIKLTSIITDIIRAIDNYRFDGDEDTSAEQAESRINAFYRMVGLPAFTDGQPHDDFANGNLFKESQIGDKVYLRDVMSKLRKREVAFKNRVDESNVKTFLDNNKSQLSIGIKDPDMHNGRKKGSLFPMVANGSLKALPRSRRISQPFFKKVPQISGDEYSRPFIETVVLMRTKGEGNVNAKLQSSLQERLKELSGDEEVSVDIVNLNYEVADIIAELFRIILSEDGVARFVDEVIKGLDETRIELKTVYYTDDNTAVAAERQYRIDNDKGELEKRKKAQEEEAAVTNLLRLLESDDTISEEATTRNVKDAALASSFFSLVTSKSTEAEETIKEEDILVEQIDQKLRILNKQMDLLLGIYSGISGIDVIVVIAALFSIPVEILLDLLNEKNKVRLAKIRPNLKGSGKGVVNAVFELEQKVKEIYEALDGKVENSYVKKQSSIGQEKR